MDKYEFRVSLQEINQLIEEKRFDEAAGVADTIDWNRVRNPETLCKVSDVYKINREYAKSRHVLMIAESRDPQNSEILYSLCELNLFLYTRDGQDNDLISAYQLKQRYQQLNPGTARSLILEYKLYKATNVSAGERIGVLERLREVQYTGRWGYELAKCYLEAGRRDQAVEECRNVTHTFAGSRYAGKAEALLEEIRQEEVRSAAVSSSDAGAAAEEREGAGSRPAPVVTAAREEPEPQEQSEPEAAAESGSTESAVPEEEPDVGQHVEQAPAEEKAAEASAPEQAGGKAAGGSAPEEADGTEASEETSGGEQPEGESQTGQEKSGEEPMSISEVMREWAKIRDDIRAKNDQKRTERLLEDTGSLMDAFDENAKHSMLEDIERNVERQQREARQGYAYSEVSGGVPYGAGNEQQGGYESLVDDYGAQDGAGRNDAGDAYGTDYGTLPQEPYGGDDTYGTQTEAAEDAGQNNTDSDSAYYYEDEAADGDHELQDGGENLDLYEGQGEQFNTAPQPYGGVNVNESYDEDAAAGEASAAEMDMSTAGTAEDDAGAGLEDGATEEELSPDDASRYGTAETTEESGEEYPHRGPATRRWSAADVRRAMQLNREKLAELEEADRAALEDAVENAGKEDEAATAEKAASATAAEENAAPEPQEAEHPEEEQPAAGEADAAEETAAAEEAPAPEGISEDVPQAEPEEAAAEETADDTEDRKPAVKGAVSRKADKAETAEAEKPGKPARVEKRGKGGTVSVPAAAADQDFSEDEKKIFGPIAYVKSNREQILAALDKVSLAGDDGNVIITGGPAAAEHCAKGLLHLIRHSDSNFSSEVAVASAEQMNKLTPEKLGRVLDKIGNGAIKVTGAGGLSEKALKILHGELENQDRGVIVLLLDTRRAMDALVQQYPELLSSFNARIDIHPLDDKALVAYGMEYARRQDYSIDELGQLALSTRISSQQTRNHHVSTAEVRAIVDEAITYASKKSLKTFFAVLTHKRYDADDRIIIHEKDFMHY